MKKQIVVVAVLCFACRLANATEYNLATDYSVNSNPTGTWTYGWFHTPLPGGSDLDLLSWNSGSSSWTATNGISLWKNDSASTVNDVPPGKVGMTTAYDQPTVVRWTAPFEIGLATIQISGELSQGATGADAQFEIRRGAGVVFTATNTATFSMQMMVAPGDEIDFVITELAGLPTKPLDISITTIKEHLALTTLDDFDHHSLLPWTTVPGMGGIDQRFEGSPPTNYYITAGNDSGWSKGAYKDLPFEITTNTDFISIRHFSKIGTGGTGSLGAPYIRLCDDSITTTNSSIVGWGQRAYAEYGEPIDAHIYFWNGEGVATGSDAPWNFGEKLEFRADMDLSYVDAEGKYGLFTLFMKRTGATIWSPVEGLVNIEMKVTDPTTITKIATILNWNPSKGYNPYIDDIRYCTGKHANKGTATNLLVGPQFNYSPRSWRTDGLAPSRIATYTPLHDGSYIYCDSSYTAEVYQVVSLPDQGFTAADIDAGLYRAAFGGWQYAGNTSLSHISVEFLNMTNQLISTSSLPVVTNGSVWAEQMATNTIPAQTRLIRYRCDLQGGRLDDAYLSVLGLPQNDVALTVASDLGSPVPTVGTTSNSYGTVVNCSVADVVSGSTQYECTGWTGTGSVPASGTSNAVVVTLTEDSSITWNWQTNYWLDVNVTGNGSVDVTDGFYTKDSEQILTATPDAGWLFMGWSGAASGTNEAFVTMSTPQTIMATFSDDADGDGLLNSNETAIGSDPWNPDTDGDGFDDAFEVQKGLSPTNDDSDVATYIQNNDSSFGLYPSNVVLDVAVGQILMDIEGGTAQFNLQLEESDDLVTWTNAGEPKVWSRPVGGEKKFFRVRSGK